jgi:MerR family transcriptional regulator, light-induced transcriptional regulator
MIPRLWNKLPQGSGQQLGAAEVSSGGAIRSYEKTSGPRYQASPRMARRPASQNFRFTGEMPSAHSGAALREAAMSDLSREQNAELTCWSETQPASDSRRSDRHRRPGNRAVAEAESRVARLTRTIEAEIIPRLLLANSQAPAVAAAARGSRRITDTDIATLVQIVLEQDTISAVRHFEQLEADGVARETLFLDLLAPAARQLGDAWQDDTLSFSAVTIALAGLQQILRHLSPQFEDRVGLRPHGRQALLFNAPGEQHSFGLFMVEAFFRRTAWDVTNASTVPMKEITDMVRRNWFDVVGISKSSDALLGDLASDITRLRRASRNKDLTILVGGPVFNARPELVIQVGADATGVDARQAVWQATKCVMALNKS